jgi:hypothetical protein
MVIEAQTEISALVPQNSGGPVKVTKMLAASDSNISDSPRRSPSERTPDSHTYLQRREDARPNALEPYHRSREK